VADGFPSYEIDRDVGEHDAVHGIVSNITSDRTILITGVTGHQGGAVTKALRGSGFHLRGLTRTPDSERAKALTREGVDVVKGDLDDETTLRRALAGAWGVFSVQN
jgi:uncharacterized protein YbjT (DUF2867 family)